MGLEMLIKQAVKEALFKGVPKYIVMGKVFCARLKQEMASFRDIVFNGGDVTYELQYRLDDSTPFSTLKLQMVVIDAPFDVYIACEIGTEFNFKKRGEEKRWWKEEKQTVPHLPTFILDYPLT